MVLTQSTYCSIYDARTCTYVCAYAHIMTIVITVLSTYVHTCWTQTHLPPNICTLFMCLLLVVLRVSICPEATPFQLLVVVCQVHAVAPKTFSLFLATLSAHSTILSVLGRTCTFCVCENLLSTLHECFSVNCRPPHEPSSVNCHPKG